MSELLWQIAAAFIGGIILNLTPCVLPVIPLKVRTLLHQQPTRGGRWWMSLSLVAGSLTVFTLLGLATAMLNLQWGFLFQSRGFLAGLSVFLLVAGGLSFLRRPLPLPRGIAALGGSRADPFVTGALAGVLSTPCTGPFLGSVLAFSMTQPPTTIVALFVAIGAGLAAPYALLILGPGLLERFPRGGAWTARVEELLGLVLLAGGVFFLQSLVSPPLAQAATFALVGLLLGWAGWHLLLPGAGGRAGWAARGVPLAALLLAAGLIQAFTGPATAERTLDWRGYSDVGLAQAQQQGRPALIEFTADWCINCKVLEKMVYADAAVVAVGDARQLLPLRVDMTSPRRDQQALLRELGGAGLPFAVVMNHRGEIVARFPDLFKAVDLIDAIRRAADGPGTG